MKEHYENDICNKLKYNDQIVEVNKDIMYKKDHKSECMIVLVVLSEQEIVDYDLQQMKSDGENTTKYISLKESSSETRFRVLYINSINNIKVWYKYIENVDLSKKVSYQGK